MKDRFISFLGITKKAGKVIEGYNKCEEALKKNSCYLIIVSQETSSNTKEKFERISNNKNIPMIVAYTSKDLSYALGKEGLNIIGIKDKPMANRLLQLWNGS
ncbi:ribosomal L7Ae/L30e/S12e/Gadd45 family protein [Clostridium tetani]|uniref:ribosomal L7Ae/L30e/S12e/Gadd45 family protein n=1 Tax=Clostridium tetani TaxID=1513 RepID=UPI00100B7CA2|nr:ribosomal L7Ae/L30e/S12e/Gadd45 family protein [Clostridium tetani]RXM58645.1 50S ribosomal protein L7ae-like protein [Clostridium tetani]